MSQSCAAPDPALLAGRFITIEGIDGAGKSTQVERVAARWRAAGLEVVRTREPGGTPLAESLRELVLHRTMDTLTETLLVFAARRTRWPCPRPPAAPPRPAPRGR